MFDDGIDDSEEEDEEDEEESEGEGPGIGDLVDGFDDLRISKLSAGSPHKDLKAFIIKHELEVISGLGGRGRWTKVDIYNDITAAFNF
jgi:hypothetical protein